MVLYGDDATPPAWMYVWTFPPVHCKKNVEVEFPGQSCTVNVQDPDVESSRAQNRISAVSAVIPDEAVSLAAA